MINLRDLVKSNEQVLWEGRPHKAVTVLEAIFNPMLIFALIWGGIDLSIMGATVSGMFGVQEEMGKFVLIFLLVHMMPVWIYLGGVLTVFFRWRNTHFMVTSHGLYVSGGLFAFNYEMKPWTDIGHINIHQGVIDRIFGVGDVVFVCNHSHSNSYSHSGHHSSENNLSIKNIPDFKAVFRIVNNLQTDVYADTMYPNALRPDTNPGYNTQYTGMDR